MKQFFASFGFITVLLSLFGCGSTPTGKLKPKAIVPDTPLMSFYYVEHGTMANPNFSYELHRLDDGTIKMTRFNMYKFGFDEEADTIRDGMETVTVGEEVMDTLLTIIREENVLDYDERYEPPFEVLDGESWSLSIEFKDTPAFHSHGNNAVPGGKGLSRFEKYLHRLTYPGDD